MLTLQLKTTCYGVSLPTMKTMMINNINNTNAWCQLVYKSLIFYYKNYKHLNQKLVFFRCTVHRCARQFLILVPARVWTYYRKHLCTSVHFTLLTTFSYYLFHSYLVDIQSIRVLYDRLTVAAQIYSLSVRVAHLIVQLPSVS